jgi:hypothetical protein
MRSTKQHWVKASGGSNSLDRATRGSEGVSLIVETADWSLQERKHESKPAVLVTFDARDMSKGTKGPDFKMATYGEDAHKRLGTKSIRSARIERYVGLSIVRETDPELQDYRKFLVRIGLVAKHSDNIWQLS